MAIELIHFSDGGPFRPTNQDAYCVRLAQTPAGLIAMVVVCDGMGGLNCGEVASATVIKAFADWFDCTLPDRIGGGITAAAISESWNDLLQQQHQKICSFGQSNDFHLGTTVSAMLLTEFQYYILQVGDSRVYLDDGRRTELLTVDQTLAMRELMAGRLKPEEFASDSRRNVLLQCVGDRTVAPVFQSGSTPRQGACLLCSDGFYHFLEPQNIHGIFSDSPDRTALQQSLLESGGSARSLGERDNMTCVALRWDEFCYAPTATVSLTEELEAPPAMELLAKVTYTNSELIL